MVDVFEPKQPPVMCVTLTQPCLYCDDTLQTPVASMTYLLAWETIIHIEVADI